MAYSEEDTHFSSIDVCGQDNDGTGVIKLNNVAISGVTTSGLIGAAGSSSAGGNATATGGAGNGAFNGGAVVLTGGASGAGATGNGGAVTSVGGAAASTNGNGGAVTLTGGAGAGTGAGGAINLTSGAAGATGVAGAISLTVGAATAGNGSAITITAGNGAGGTASGGDINLVPGTAVSTGTPGEVKVNGAAGLFAVSFMDGANASSATSVSFFIAPRACRVVAAYESHAVAAGGTSTMTLTKDASGTAPGGGTSLHQSGSFDLNATANTPQSATITTTVATKTLAAGDRISTKYANTIQSSAGITVTVLLAPC